MSVSTPSLPSALPLRVWVAGRARTKGSLRWEGRRAVEQVAGSSAWRQQVAETILRQLGAQMAPGGPVAHWRPEGGPVAVRVIIWLPRPARVPPWVVYASERNRNDLDKLQRNLGDALSDTQVIVDDGVIVHWDTWKLWAPQPGAIGVDIEVRAVTEGSGHE